MKKIIILLILIFSCSWIMAQSISGTIKDENGNPVDFATVILQSSDSTYTSAVYSDSLGYFNFDKDLPSYQLTVQHLMYETWSANLESQKQIDIQVQKKSFTLGEVEVKGQAPIMKVSEGKLTYNMAQVSKNTTASSAYDAILNLPAVYEKDNKINLAGASNVNIIINGKPSTMTYEQLQTLLQNMPKERLLSAEVMYSTPAQYNVRGASINLILNNKLSETPTLQGQINGSYGQAFYPKAQGGINMMYSTPKSTTDFMYSFNYAKIKSGQDLYSQHLYNSKIYDIIQNNREKAYKPIHNIRIGNEYHFNDNSKINLAYTAQIQAWRVGEVHSDGTFGSSSNTKKLDSPLQLHNISLDYTSETLKVGGNYTFYRNHSIQDFDGDSDNFITRSKQNINKVSLYADNSNSIGKEWTINYGAKYSFAQDHSSQNYESINNKYNNSDNELNEYTYNVYGGFSKSFSDKLSLTGSVMGEYYKHKEKDYWSIFPQFELTYSANVNNIFQASLSSDKDYPSYWEMTDATSYLNAYTQIQGNPLLRPSKSYELNLTYIFKNKYVFSIYGEYDKDYFSQLPYQSNDELALIYQTTNFDYSKQVGFNITAPFSIGSILNSNVTVTGFYHKVKSNNFHKLSFKNDLFTYFAMMSNTLNISNNLKGEINAMYTPKNIQGPATLSSMYKIDAGIKWQSNDKNCEIRLKAQDIFNKWSPKMVKTHFDNQHIDMHVIPDSRLVSISFTYKFGGYKAKPQQQVDSSRFGSQ